MSLRIQLVMCVASLALTAPAALAQFSITKYTIDAGGVTSPAGAMFTLGGTVGQPDAGGMIGGSFSLTGGFWGGVASTCRADFNASGTRTVQDIFDFLAAYFSGSAAADFNQSGAISIQDLFDFLAAYFSGC